MHRLEDLAIKSGNDDLLSNADFLAIFKAHDKVAVDEKTGLYRYKAGSRSVEGTAPYLECSPTLIFKIERIWSGC